MKITYNAPVVLSFSLICAAILSLNAVFPFLIHGFFTVGSRMSFFNPLDYFRLFSHSMGHADWQHLVGNMTFILLLGPILEEKYGSAKMILMILVTATVTGLLNVMLFPTSLLGASGIVFMMILLSSVVNVKSSKEVPLTFLLVVLLYLGKEVVAIFGHDNVSQAGHIIGGICGSFFGFGITKNNRIDS